MKTIVSLAVVALAIGASSLARGQDPNEKMMAEMQNCAVCKYLAEKPVLMKEMIWETHKIDNGMLSVAAVPKALKHEYEAVDAKMMQAVEQVKADAQQAKPVQLCSYCVAIGELMKAGAKEQHIATSAGTIDLFTSDDPNVVKKIHELADKAIAAQQAMAQNAGG
jgi:hypothetical protein